MEKLNGLDEDIMEETEEKGSEKVSSFEEEKKKRKPFHYWTVNGVDHKMKLTTAMVTKLENKYRRNLMNLVMGDEIPPLSIMLTVAQAAIAPWEHKVSYEKVQGLFDSWLDDGGDQLKFYSRIIIPTMAVSGFFTQDQAESIMKSWEMEMDLM